MKKVLKNFIFTCIFTLLATFTSGFSVSGDATIHHNGKASAILNISSTLKLDEFEENLNTKIKQYNIASGSGDMITIDNITSVIDGYDVKVQLRRLDKVKIQGDFYLEKLSEFVSDNSETQIMLSNAVKGNIKCTVSAYYDGNLSTINVSRDSKVEVNPYTAENEVVQIEEFLEESKTAKDNSMMFFFRNFDLDSVNKITLTVPGTISHYGGSSMKVIDKNTVEIIPQKIPVTINKTVYYMEDGVEKTKIEVEKKTDAQGIVGFVVYDKSISPFSISLIIIVGLLFLFILTKVYFSFRSLGKRVLNERSKEVS